MQPPPRIAAPRGRLLGIALGLYFTLLGLSGVGAVLILTKAASEVTSLMLTSAASCAAVLLYLAKAFRPVRPGLIRRGKLWWYPAAAGLGGATFLVATLVVALLVTLGAREIRFGQRFLEAGYGWGTVVLLVCVVPALFEELAFRGVILAAFREVLGVPETVIVSAVLFMVLHLSVLSSAHLLLIGLVLGYVRIASGSLYPCMLLHFTHNLLAVLGEMQGL